MLHVHRNFMKWRGSSPPPLPSTSPRRTGATKEEVAIAAALMRKPRLMKRTLPEDFQITPRTKLYTTMEMVHVVRHGRGGGPKLADYLSAILNRGKVKKENSTDSTFSFTLDDHPTEFVVGLLEEEPSEECRYFKDVLSSFSSYVVKEYCTNGMGPLQFSAKLPQPTKQEETALDDERSPSFEGGVVVKEENTSPCWNGQQEVTTAFEQQAANDPAASEDVVTTMDDDLIPWNDMSPDTTEKMLYSLVASNPNNDDKKTSRYHLRKNRLLPPPLILPPDLVSWSPLPTTTAATPAGEKERTIGFFRQKPES